MLDSSYEDDGIYNYLVFLSVCFKMAANSNKVTGWKSRCLPEECIKPPATFNNNPNPEISYIYNPKIC